MNGNFSFGDYFKAEAIRYAWELVTGSQDAGGLGFDPEQRLGHRAAHRRRGGRAVGQHRRACRRSGSSAAGCWTTTGTWASPARAVPAARSTSTAGPSTGRDGGPVVDEDRFLEIWNLVFMQEELSAVRAKDDFDILGDLPRKNIDTGMGLERVAYLLQGVDNLYEIDEVFPVIQRGGRAVRPPLRPGRRRRPRGRRPDAGGRRPRPLQPDADRRRRHARQRGARLRAAPAAAPHGALDAAARRARPGAARAAAGQPRRRWGRPTPRSSRTSTGSRASPTARRTRSAAPSPRAPRSSTWPCPTPRPRQQPRAVAASGRSSCTTPTASRST